MAKTHKKVVTVVVTYNAFSGGFFPKCLGHLRLVELENEDLSLEHEVIVVDSNSKDETPQLIKDTFPEVRLIASPENIGYAGGNNVGIREALKGGADYVAVVTQDVYVSPDWLLQAVAAAETEPSIGAVQPLLLLWPESELINSTGNQIHFLGYGFAGDYKLPREEYRSSQLSDIPYFSGAIVLLSCKALREVGDFDEEMWMYNEDQDLGWRMWLHGYRNVLAPLSTAHHQYEFRRSIAKLYYMDRNRLLAVFQNYHWLTLFLIMPALLINELAGLLLALKGGWAKEKLKVWLYFLKVGSWNKLGEKRRLRQQTRAVSDRAIVQRFTGRILFQDFLSPLIKYVANPVLGLYWAIVSRLIIW